MLMILSSACGVNKACSSSGSLTVSGSLVVVTGSYCHFVDPYEDEPTVRLSSALGSEEAVILVLEVSSQLPPPVSSLLCSHCCAPFLNGLKHCRENVPVLLFFFFFSCIHSSGLNLAFLWSFFHQIDF